MRRGRRGGALRKVVLLAVAVLPGVTALRADLDPGRWGYRRAIQAPDGAEGVVRFRVDSELYDKCLPDLADLRIADRLGRETPFASRLESGSSRPGWISCDSCGPYNETYLPGRSGSATFHFGADRQKKTALLISTPGKDFRREVKVEASEDGARWSVLREGALLFDIQETPDGKPFRKEEVPIPPSDLPYLRVTVFNGPGDPPRVKISRMMWESLATEPPVLESVPLRVLSENEDRELHFSEILLDAGTRNRPIHSLHLEFEDPNFYRRVEVSGRNSETEVVNVPAEDAPSRKITRPSPWISLGEGTIYRITAGQAEDSHSDLNLSGPGIRFLRVRVFHGDDRPLSLREVRADSVVRNVLFPATAGTTYTLYYGNPRARKPGYDLTHFLPRLEGEGVLDAALDAPEENPQYRGEGQSPAWSERHPVILWSALLLAAGVLAALIRNLARSGRTADGA